MSNYPSVFEDLNTETSKQLNVVVEIEGFSDYISMVPTSKRIRYGDPGLVYGMPGVVYGGLLEIDNVKPYLTTNSSLVVSQKLEPEQGRASASTLSLEILDKDGYMTSLVSPGVQLDEILGGKLVKIYLGYTNSSFKEDYYVVFRGYVTSVKSVATKMVLQLTDANFKRKQQVFLLGKSKINPVPTNFSPSAVNVSANTIDTGGDHYLSVGDGVTFTSTGSLPAPLVAATEYFIQSVPTSTTFTLSATLGGGVLDITTQGTGIHTVKRSSLAVGSTKIPLYKTDGFAQHILGIDGTYDTSVKTYLKIEDEYMQYVNGAIDSTYITVSRGARSTIPTRHSIDAEVNNHANLEGNVIDLALKIMLSGWNGNWKSGVAIKSFVDMLDPVIGSKNNALYLANNDDANDVYGLVVGDQITITGSSGGLNDKVCIITGFDTAFGFKNNVIYTDQTFTLESPTTAVFAIRSKYDTLPKVLGNKLKPVDVDIANYELNKSYFFSQSDNTMSLLITQPESGKEFIEKELLLPVGAYSLTRFGRISMGATKPPIVGTDLVVLNNTNITNPQNITVTRALNNRRFFNEIQYYYDFSDADEATSILDRLDTNSLNLIDVSSVLPINSRGLRTELGAAGLIARRGDYILRRFKDAAYEIELSTNWQAVSLIEAGDVVALFDNGDLQICNFQTGERNLGSQLFEVINRELDIKAGTGKLLLLSSLGYQLTDRFATISPSSVVGVGSGYDTIVITDSYGKLYPGAEWKKYKDFIGEKIVVHNADWSVSGTTTLDGFDPGDPYTMLVTPALSFIPSAGYIIDIPKYPTTTVKSDQEKYKLFFAHLTPSLTVVSGPNGSFSFCVDASEIGQINIGLTVMIHNADYSTQSFESKVLSYSLVFATTYKVNVESSFGIGIVPGDRVELVGYKDLQGPYLIL